MLWCGFGFLWFCLITFGEKLVFGPAEGQLNFTTWLSVWLVMVKLSWYEHPT